MPLLSCPNDNDAMQIIQRSGVEFDMCPACRGVWLDRGELEKMLAVARDSAYGTAQTDNQFRERRHTDEKPQSRRHRDQEEDSDDFRHGNRRSSIFEIFD